MASIQFNGLAMIHNYDSDSDADSGYKSEEENKRKNTSYLPQRNKRFKKNELEDMVIDYEGSIDSSSHMSNQPVICDTISTINNARGRNDLLPSSNQESNMTVRSIPLPDEFLEVSEECDDSDHQGRIRSFPHERGNWASLLYIPSSFGTLKPHLDSMISSLVVSCKNADLDLVPCKDFHISLSPTFVVRLDWINPIVDGLRKKLSSIHKFSACFLDLSIFCNDERTRTFLVLKVGFGKDKMKTISQSAEEVLRKYELDISYEHFTYHISVAWCLGDCEEKLRSLLPLLGNICNSYFSTESDLNVIDVSNIYLKTGNRIHRFPLRL